MVRSILSANPGWVNERSPDESERGMRPLHKAADELVVGVLLDHGADVSIQDDRGRTPLHMAANAEVVDLLTEKGADVHAGDRGGETPLHTVGSESAAEALLRHGAEINAGIAKRKSPLRRQIMDGHTDVVRLLIARGALRDHEQYAYRTQTWLHLAVQHADADMVQCIIDYARPDVNARTASTGATPLHYASLQNKLDIARVLLENGADPDMELSKDARITKFAAFVSPNAPEIRVRTAYGVAASDEMRELLKEHGAVVK